MYVVCRCMHVVCRCVRQMHSVVSTRVSPALGSHSYRPRDLYATGIVDDSTVTASASSGTGDASGGAGVSSVVNYTVITKLPTRLRVYLPTQARVQIRDSTDTHVVISVGTPLAHHWHITGCFLQVDRRRCSFASFSCIR